jgi:hypothetical protein
MRIALTQETNPKMKNSMPMMPMEMLVALLERLEALTAAVPIVSVLASNYFITFL